MDLLIFPEVDSVQITYKKNIFDITNQNICYWFYFNVNYTLFEKINNLTEKHNFEYSL